MAALFFNFIILAGLSHLASRRFTSNRWDALAAAVFLYWFNIVATSLVLSSAGLLGSPGWFFRTSLLLAVVVWLAARRWIAPPANESVPAPESINRLLLIGVGGSLALFFAGSLWIALVYPPNNYDSLTYHLPRVLFYLGQDSLAHFDSGNPRQTYFPFNYNLLHLSCLVYGTPWKFVTLFNLLAWASAGLLVQRIARHSGMSANHSLVAAWMACVSTQVLAQGSATTNDLPTAVAVLGAILFGQRWIKHRAPSDALLSAMIAGLAIGTKLTIVFFGPPALLLVALGLARELRAAPADLKRLGPILTHWLPPLVPAILMVLPFVLFNLKATGEWMTDRYDFTLNQPFSLGCAWQTGVGYTTQLFIEPLQRFTLDYEFTGQLNEWANVHLFPHWNNTYAFSPLYVFPPDLNEDHVWFGFTGPLIVLCALWVLARDWRLRSPESWLALLGIGWFLIYFGLNKWSLYIQRYFVPPILVMAPCVAVALRDMIKLRAVRRNLLRLPFVLAAGTTTWFGGHYLVKNTNRPLEPLLKNSYAKPAYPSLPSPLVQALRDQTDINIDTYAGNERIFLLMNVPTRARFTASEEIDPDKYNVLSHWGYVRLNLYSNVASFSSYAIVDFPDKPTAGVTALGTFDHGVNAWDYWGLPPQAGAKASNPENQKILLSIYHAAAEPDRYAESRLKVVGLNPGDHARLDVFVARADGSREQIQTFGETGIKEASIRGPFTGLEMELRDRDSNALISTGVLPYGQLEKAPDNRPLAAPNAIFVSDCIEPGKRLPVTADGLAALEGPYDEWELPRFRWMKKPTLTLEVPPVSGMTQIRITMGIRLQVRLDAALAIYHNGEFVERIKLHGHHVWYDKVIDLPAAEGDNIIELRDVPPNEIVDAETYLNAHPEVRPLLTRTDISIEESVQLHYETTGQALGWTLPMKLSPFQPDPPVESLYFIFRTLMIEGLGE